MSAEWELRSISVGTWDGAYLRSIRISRQIGWRSGYDLDRDIGHIILMVDEREIIYVSKATLAQWQAIESEVRKLMHNHNDFYAFAFEEWLDLNGKTSNDMLDLWEYLTSIDTYGTEAFTVIG